MKKNLQLKNIVMLLETPNSADFTLKFCFPKNMI